MCLRMKRATAWSASESSRLTELRVAVDARLQSGTAGGVESVVIGLAHGLANLADGSERYLFLCRDDSTSWLEPYLGANTDILLTRTPRRGGAASVRGVAKRMAPGARTLWRRRPLMPREKIPGPTPSDGTIEAAGVAVVHFTLQNGFLTNVPSIYQPHDLQHIHLPAFFSARERAIADIRYRTLCDQASIVVVTSEWGRRDLLTQFGLPPGKVRVIPWAPATAAYPRPTESQMAELRQRLRLPERYVLYPAQTWPHKNHEALLRAVALLRDRDGTVINLVFSGHRNDYARIVDRWVEKLGLVNQVWWAGFVLPVELQGLYSMATAVVIPSKFEAASGPLWEAFLAGVPAAVAAVTSLPEQAGDAALLFDPDDPASIADAVARLWTDPRLRQTLQSAGRVNVSRYDWETTARKFRVEYRVLAGQPLSKADQELRSSLSPL